MPRPRGSSHQTALFHLFLSPLFLFIPVPLNSHNKWNRGLDDWLATDTDQPTSGYWRSSVSLCSSVLFLCLFGLVQWTVGLLRSVLVHAAALRWNRDRSLSSGKYFHHSFLFSCESHGVIKSGKACIPECHIQRSQRVWDDIGNRISWTLFKYIDHVILLYKWSDFLASFERCSEAFSKSSIQKFKGVC